MGEHKVEAPGGWARIVGACGTATDRRQNRMIIVWTLVWGVGLTLGSQTLKGRFFEWQPGSVVGWIAAVVPVVLFLGVLRAYLLFVQKTDELQRLIQLQALAVGFGAGVLLLMHWELFEYVGAPAIDPGDAALVPILSWVLSTVYLAWKYR